MTSKLSDSLLANARIVNEQALEYFKDYGALSRIEAWRWTPLSALNTPRQTATGADYQLSLPSAAIESYDNDPDTAQRWQALRDAPFAWLNYALLEEALIITVPDGVRLDETIALNINALRKQFQCARIEIQVGEGATADFWLDIQATEQAAQLPVITLNVGDGATVQGVIWTAGADKTAQLSHLLATLGRESQCRINTILHGGALSRFDLEAQLHGEGAEFHFGAIQLADKADIVDCHLVVRHETAHCVSRQTLRGALKGEALGILDGMAYVAHGAQKTDGQQDCRYLLLSPTAKSHSAPRLEIYADDVQCAHGSTVGFLDQEALFYLQSRGIDRESARDILVLSFLQEAVVVEDELGEAVSAAVHEVWSGGRELS